MAAVLGNYVVASGVMDWLAHFLASLTLTNAYIPKADYFFSFNSPSWSLCCEQLFYFCFPFLIPLAKSYRRLLYAFLAMAVAVVVGMYLTPPEEIKGYWYVNPITRFPDFILGMFNPAHQLPDLKVGEMYAEVAAYTKAGNFGDFLLGNITLGQKASLFWAINAGRFFQTAGLFLLGFYIGRKQLFVSSEKNLRIWVKTLIVAAISFAPLYTLKDLIMKNDAIVQQSAGTAFDMWQKLAFTLVLVTSFVILYQNRTFSKMVGNLRFYGKMSLTNYITQSIIGAAIYFPFGLYLAPYCGYTVSLLIGLFTFFLQVLFCKWWLGKHKQGPLEYIWHKWTWIGTDK